MKALSSSCSYFPQVATPRTKPTISIRETSYLQEYYDHPIFTSNEESPDDYYIIINVKHNQRMVLESVCIIIIFFLFLFSPLVLWNLTDWKG